MTAALPAGRSTALAGIACVFTACAFLSLADALAKILTESLPILEICLLRSAVAMIPVLAIARAYGPWRGLTTRHPVKQLLRGGFIVGSYLSFLAALQSLPLAETASVFFSAPLFIAAFSPLVLKEPVPARRWIAIALGFAGVVVIMRPGTAAFRPEALYALASALLYSFGALLARRLGAIERPSTTSFYTALVFLLASGPATALTPGLWVTPDWNATGYVVLCGLVAGSAHFLLIQGYRLGEAAVVAPFEYSVLLWAVLFGWLIWGQLPNQTAVLGIALVAASGLYVLRSERR